MKHLKYIIILCFLTASIIQQSFSQNVTFKNELLEKHIKIQLALDTLQPLPKAVADTVTRLDCSFMAIENIWDLRNFPALQNVDLSHNAISNIDVLAILPNLKVVNLFSNQLHDADALFEADASSMIINLGNNYISDFVLLYNSPYCFFTVIGEKSQKRSRFAEQNRINSLYIVPSNISSNQFVFYSDCWSNVHSTATLDFGDGNTATVHANGFTDSLAHTYETPGKYYVTLSLGNKTKVDSVEVKTLFKLSSSIENEILGGINIVDYNNDGLLDMLCNRIKNNEFFNQLYIGIDQEYMGNRNWFESNGSSDVIRFLFDVNNDNYQDIVFDNDIVQINFFSGTGGNINISFDKLITVFDYDNDTKNEFIHADFGSKSILASEIDFITGNIISTDTVLVVPDYFYDNVSNNSIYIKWADYDNDSDYDMYIFGDRGGVVSGTDRMFSDIYNNDNKNFVKIKSDNTEIWSNAEWFDYDGDGDLDIFIIGNTDSGELKEVLYRNDGNNTFIDVKLGLPIEQYKVGDFNNNGQKDLLFEYSEHTDGTANEFCKIYDIQNNNLQEIVSNESEKITTRIKSCNIGDFNRDGNLDFVIVNNANNLNKMDTYLNNNDKLNVRPSTPLSLSSIVNQRTVDLKWNSASDDITPQQSLSYNIYIRNEGGYFLAPNSLPDGTRTIVGMGNVQLNTSWKIHDLAPGTYYWSVQAIDNAYAGGVFAEEQSFVVLPKPEIKAWQISDNLDIEIPIIGGIKVCNNNDVELKLSASDGHSYLWSTGETTKDIVINQSGNYTIQISDANGSISSVSDTAKVTINPLPEKPTITPSGSIEISGNETITIHAPESYSAYLWSNGETTENIVVNEAGEYSVIVTDANGCQSLASESTIVTQASNRPPIVQNPFGDQTAAKGMSINFTIPENTFFDPDENDQLVFRASQADNSLLPWWLGFDAESRTFSGFPENEEVINVKVTATDNQGQSIDYLFILTVNEQICGSITQDVVWQEFVQIGCETTVEEGATLTIKQGTTVQFVGHHKLIVNGNLQAIGTQNDKIYFIGFDVTDFDDITKSESGWHGIRFMNYEATTDTSRMVHCIMQSGKATDGDLETNYWDDTGGAIFANYTNLEIENCTFRDNIAERNGGALYIKNSPYCKLFENEFYENRGDSASGAIKALYSNITLVKNNIYNNVSYGWGGGININKCIIKATGNTFNNNSTKISGGGIYVTESNGLFSNNTITNNKAEWGAGIYMYEDTIIFENNNVISNSATSGGGGLRIKDSRESYIRNNKYKNNIGKWGAAMQIVNSDCYITSNLIYENRATISAGGIYFFNTGSKVLNNTIANNKAEYGGAVFFDNSSPQLINNILWNNNIVDEVGTIIDKNEIHIFDNTSVPEFRYCNISGGRNAFRYNSNASSFSGIYQNCMDTEPLFEDQPPYYLSASSPMIDAGMYNMAGYELAELDYYKNLRIYNSNIDIGALEFNGVGVSIDENKQNSQIKIYPNPTEGIFTIDVINKSLNELQLKIINTLGQTIYNKKMDAKIPLNVDLSKQGKGMYFIELSNKNTKTVEKLIIK